MKAKDYLKSKNIWLGTKVADMNAPEKYFELEHLLEEYHQAKLKLLGIADVVGRSEQFTFEDMRNAFDAGAWEHHIHDFDSWIKTQK
jgi:hypothetical protein